MYTEQIQDMFNFSMSIEDIEEEIIYQYSLEKKGSTKDNLLSDKVINKSDFKDNLYAILSNPKSVFDWKAIENTNDIDHLIAKIDAKIALLEQEEKDKKDSEEGDEDVCVIEPDNDVNGYAKEDVLLSFDENNSLKKFLPQSDFSDYYNLLYAVVYLYKYVLRFENQNIGKLLIDNGDTSKYIFPFSKERILIYKIIDFISGQDNNRLRNSDDLVKLSSDYLKSVCMKLFSDNNCDDYNYRFLMLAIQLNAFIRAILDPNIKKEAAIQLAMSTVSLHCAEICYQKDDNDNGIKFSVIALRCDNPEDRQDAFNLLGLCAIESNQYQLAYDAYFSWINKRMIDCIEIDYCFKQELLTELNIELKSDDEQVWREQKQKAVALMYGNYAYVCGAMYNILKMSTQRDELICIAKHYIMLAIECDPESYEYFCSAGTIFSDAQDNKKALIYYREYYVKAKTNAEKIDALRSMLLIYGENFSENVIEDFDRIADEFLQRCKQLVNDNNETVQAALIYARDLYFLLSECNRLSNEIRNLKYLLFQIDNDVKDILGSLRQKVYVAPSFNLHRNLFTEKKHQIFQSKNSNSNEQYTENEQDENQVKEIVYYTKLRDLEYLFSEIPQKTGDPLNCLTMMHARYMNDPEEGLVLLQKLRDFLPKSPENLRNELYNQKFVFLKSFTGLVDQLNMWTMYGSDREGGSDCNGCCVCIAPETFDILTNTQNKSAAQLSSHSDDDYYLYSVAYIDGEKIFVNGNRNLFLEQRYKHLEKLLSKLNNALKGVSDIDINIISNCLVRLLEKPMFLFKDISYYLEVERRLIITRDVKDRVEIKKTDQEPPKLYINPAFQVYPEKIILGPKVDTPDYWIPHLQYELSKISEKWPFSSKREFKPTVGISRINIR